MKRAPSSSIVSLANDQLTPDLLPPPAATWREIGRFALTFPGYSHFPGPELEQVTQAVASAFHAGSSLRTFKMSELRACLFWEQRRLRWLGLEPTEDEMKYIRTLLEALRNKVVACS